MIHLTGLDDPAPIDQVDGFIQGDRGRARCGVLARQLAGRYLLGIPVDLPAGPYRLLAGIYRSSAAWERLPVRTPGRADATDSLLLGQVQVTQ